jgi:hypothetical protein
VDERDLAVVMGWPDDEERAARVAAGLVAEGIVASDGTQFSLAG